MRLAVNGWKDGERKLGYALDAVRDGNSRCARAAFPDLSQLPSQSPQDVSQKFSSARTEEKYLEVK